MPLHMRDGLSTILSIGDTGYICEKTVTPPGLDAGEAIDISCMRSGFNFRKWPKQRKTWTPITATVAWSPEVYDFNLNLPANNGVLTVGLNQLMNILFPDGDLLIFWGTVQKFLPNEHKEGEQPTAVITIELTLTDDDGLAVDPVFIPIA